MQKIKHSNVHFRQKLVKSFCFMNNSESLTKIGASASLNKNKMHKANWKVILIYMLILAGAVLLMTTIFMAPFLKSKLPFVSDLLYAVYSPLCHQNPSRCFVFFGYPLAVCTRCLGIYAGFLLGTCFYPLFRNLRIQSLPRREVLIALSLPIVIDATGNLILLWMTNEWIRLFTGVLWGSILPFFLIPGLIDMVLNKISSAKPGVLPLSQPMGIPE